MIEIENPPGGGSGPATSSGLTMSTNRLLGRTTAGTGAIEEIAVSDLTLSAGVLALPAGSVIQTVSSTFTGTTVITGVTPADTGASAAINPGSASNKVRVTVQLSYGTSPTAGAVLFLQRNGVTISGAVGATAGSRISCTAAGFTNTSNTIQTHCIEFLDSPASTSAQTYRIAAASVVAGQAVYINRGDTDVNGATTPRACSTVTLMEIKG